MSGADARTFPRRTRGLISRIPSVRSITRSLRTSRSAPARWFIRCRQDASRGSTRSTGPGARSANAITSPRSRASCRISRSRTTSSPRCSSIISATGSRSVRLHGVRMSGSRRCGTCRTASLRCWKAGSPPCSTSSARRQSNMPMRRRVRGLQLRMEGGDAILPRTLQAECRRPA